MRAPNPVPELPVYQATVFDAPLTSDVAEPNGGAADPQRRLNGAVTVPLNPSAANADGFELVTERSAALSVCSAITPPLDGRGGRGAR